MKAELQIADGFLAEHRLSPEQMLDAVEKAMLSLAHPETAELFAVTGKFVLMDELAAS